jgi:hypothetical protein
MLDQPTPDSQPEIFTDLTALRRWVAAIGGTDALAHALQIAPRTAQRIVSGKFRLKRTMAAQIATLAGEAISSPSSCDGEGDHPQDGGGVSRSAEAAGEQLP